MWSLMALTGDQWSPQLPSARFIRKVYNFVDLFFCIVLFSDVFIETKHCQFATWLSLLTCTMIRTTKNWYFFILLSSTSVEGLIWRLCAMNCCLGLVFPTSVIQTDKPYSKVGRSNSSTLVQFHVKSYSILKLAFMTNHDLRETDVGIWW